MPSPGTRGIDYSGWRPSSMAQVKQDGAGFIIRYSAGAGNATSQVAWKLCQSNEIAQATAAGLDFVANSEWYATRVTEGAGAGTSDGLADLAFWKSRGLNKGSTIYVSWDAKPDPSKYNAVEAYLKAYRAALGGYYNSEGNGLYAGTPALVEMLKRGAISKAWRSNASSWSNDGLPYQPATQTASECQAFIAAALKACPANIIQTGNYWYGNNADEDLVVRSPIGSHLENKPVPTPPKPPAPVVHPTTGDDLLDFAYSLVYGQQWGRWNLATHPSLMKDIGPGLKAAVDKLGL